ncbi:hypothetical protein DYD21_16790 [Rhodohalobacter sp. SW132]|uniref:TrlF family AAA-like ATPase n=1 Tax=Rhodohalobacter sp. SW132 TaxID=2293433 RepID=UPI000E23A1EE|nr:hypothetical protein [Rhodohalobacter sp. SW132]REL24816.1 hypothetical protein DYD21_16790 [Rhodohalobacter sp. SW132]
MRNQEFNKRGSSWRKWDLHVHTPISIEQNYGGDQGWDKYFDDLRKLPEEVEVLGINDYLFLDGYWRVKEEWEAGNLPNIKLLLPVVELRLDKFGNSGGSLSRANYHVVFSNEVDSSIEPQFLNNLESTGYQIGDYEWDKSPTRDAVEELGREIKNRVPDGVLPPNGSDLKVGHDNLNITLKSIKTALSKSDFKGKALTAVGLVEWKDIRWEGSGAEKKSLIDKCDFVFTASPDIESYNRSKQYLIDNQVNPRLIHASDAHNNLDSTESNKLGHTYTWIKCDPTFEGLKQSIIEFDTRIRISENKPVAPVNQIEKVSFDFPPETELKSKSATDTFCFRGSHKFYFSPYFTAIIGGRGSGKSTLLNLIAEKIKPGKSNYFKQKELIPDSVNIQECVDIDGVTTPEKVEFLEQNEIEKFAVDYKSFTEAIYQRIFKLDDESKLAEIEFEAHELQDTYTTHRNNLKRKSDLIEQKKKIESQLSTQKSIVESFTDEEYVKLNDDLKELTTLKQSLESSKKRFNIFNDKIKEALASVTEIEKEPDDYNEFDLVFTEYLEGVQSSKDSAESNELLAKGEAKIDGLIEKIAEKKLAIEKFLGSKGHTLENLKDISGANERIASLESELREVSQSLARLERFTLNEPYKRDLVGTFNVNINQVLEPINEKLNVQNDQVKPIKIEFNFDESHFVNEANKFIIEKIKEFSEGKIREDHIASRLEGVNLKEIANKDDLLRVIADDGTVTSTAMKDYFNNSLNFEMLRGFIEYELLRLKKYGRFNIYYDERPLENNSFGQRCTATLVILLLLGNTPIIIDEPEAHLDSKLIAEYLVDLIKEKKLERQIIFATHNANFVVNGDADLIHCLRIDDVSKVTHSEDITIEDVGSRSSLLALEGGKEAFQRREDRYGLRI